jgi:hypothetical protein
MLIEIDSADAVVPLLDNDDVSGIALKGGIEQRPGLKDVELLNDVLELLEMED